MPSLDQRDEGRKLLSNPTDGDGAMEERLPNEGRGRAPWLPPEEPCWPSKEEPGERYSDTSSSCSLSPANFLPLARPDQKPELKGAQVWGLWGSPPWDTDLGKK